LCLDTVRYCRSRQCVCLGYGVDRLGRSHSRGRRLSWLRGPALQSVGCWRGDRMARYCLTTGIAMIQASDNSLGRADLVERGRRALTGPVFWRIRRNERDSHLLQGAENLRQPSFIDAVTHSLCRSIVRAPIVTGGTEKSSSPQLLPQASQTAQRPLFFFDDESRIDLDGRIMQCHHRSRAVTTGHPLHASSRLGGVSCRVTIARPLLAIRAASCEPLQMPSGLQHLRAPTISIGPRPVMRCAICKHQ